jgi:glyoxylase-like metal-dependent hydrolase (beta-lactamase superfamily II)
MSGAPTLLPHPYSRPPRRGAVPLISPLELAAALASPQPPLLVDVRPDVERSFARLPGDLPFPLHDLPQSHGQLPRTRPMVVYDQFGSQARRAVEFLIAQGHPNAVALEGGIDEYARVADPTIPRYDPHTTEGGLVLQPFPRMDSGCLTYLVADPFSQTAVLIDPGIQIDPYLATLHDAHWRLAAIVETHTHADHLAGHAALHRATDAPIFVSRLSPAQYPHRTLSEGESVSFGGDELLTLETPGHTRDHLTLRLRDKVFTGDTLLIGGCGRTDLGDGSPELLWESLTEKLLRLPPDTEVYPAHFGKRHALIERTVSSIGFERATNEALNQGSREAFLKYMTEGWPPKPADFEAIVSANLAD